MKKLTLISALIFVTGLANVAMARDLSKRIDTLGGDKELVKKAQALDARNKFRVVQKRAVDRNWRMELGANVSMHSGGDPYVETQSYGGFFDLHINPRWSIGVRHNENMNTLTSEGKRVFDEAERNGLLQDPFQRPAIDYPLSSTLGVISFYPVYGKLNLFDTAVTQFDLYMLGGYGQVKLSSGASDAWTAGGGIGIWWNQHFSTRAEVRYQSYEDKIYTGSRDIDLVVSTLSFGFIL
jgi:outer membrane immunogenic protein